MYLNKIIPEFPKNVNTVSNEVPNINNLVFFGAIIMCGAPTTNYIESKLITKVHQEFNRRIKLPLAQPCKVPAFIAKCEIKINVSKTT